MSLKPTPTTLGAIEALLNAGVASPKEALEAAHRLGKFDGMLEMMQLEREPLKELT